MRSRIASRIRYISSLVLTILVISKRALLFKVGYRQITFRVLYISTFLMSGLGLLFSILNDEIIGFSLQLGILYFSFKSREVSKTNLMKLAFCMLFSLIVGVLDGGILV